MKLLIAEKIHFYRKKMNLTQEELAASIGVSPQAVSGWERNCGYPDITLLPGIARTLGITIDELMGNDEISANDDIEQFYKKLWEVCPEEKLKMSIEYYHKYPNVFDLADTLIMFLSDRDYGFYKDPENMTLLREACDRIIENCADNAMRYNAIDAMSRCLGDDEAKRWLEMNPRNYGFVYGEVLENRLWERDVPEPARTQMYINNLSIMLHFIGRESHHNGNPEISIAHNEYLRTLIRTFGKNGEIPDGWMGKYAFITMRQSAGLFGKGLVEEGFAVFAEAIAAYEKLFSLPDGVPLDLGNPAFFGGITVVQHRGTGNFDSFEDADGSAVDLREANYFVQNQPYLYNLLTKPYGWEWFNGVRDDSRFVSAVEWAKKLSDEWVANRNK